MSSKSMIYWHVHMLIWMKDQPNIMEALNCKDKKKQIELLQNALDWYSF